MAERVTRSHHEAEALAAGLPPLMVAAERVATTVSQGVHGRRRVGQGETFWQFRRYEPGDTVQHIDWRQSAKNDPVYIRENEWEAAQSVWLWRDGSPSMSFMSSDELEPKCGRADLLLMALASLMIRGGEHVSMLGTGALPATGRKVLMRLWNDIESGSLAESGLPGFEPLPRHGRLLIFTHHSQAYQKKESNETYFTHISRLGLHHCIDRCQKRKASLYTKLFKLPWE